MCCAFYCVCSLGYVYHSIAVCILMIKMSNILESKERKGRKAERARNLEWGKNRGERGESVKENNKEIVYGSPHCYLFQMLKVFCL